LGQFPLIGRGPALLKDLLLLRRGILEFAFQTGCGRYLPLLSWGKEEESIYKLLVKGIGMVGAIFRRMYRSFLDSFFLDENVYVGESFTYCNTDDWEELSPEARIDSILGVSVCIKN
jgi:hypothetical protein